MSEDTEPKPKQKVFDVTKPGQSVPSQNSRPTILSHSALPHDPMVSRDDSNSLGDSIAEDIEELLDEPDEIKARSEKSSIEPLLADDSADSVPSEEADDSIKDDNASKSVETDKAEESHKVVKHSGLVVEPLSDKKEDEKKPTKEDEDELDEINEIAGQAAAKDAKKSEDEAERKRFQAAQELSESKIYNVPIGKRKGKNVAVWVAVLIILATAAIGVGYWYLTS